MDTLTLNQFRGMFEAGGFRSVGVTAAGAVFIVTAEPSAGDRVGLATTRGKAPRVFRDAGKAIALLHRLGARKVEVDTVAWTPDADTAPGLVRPDTAERQRRAHAAAEHDAWFRAEVERGLAEADGADAEWISNEAVMAESRRLRVLWRSQIREGD